MTKSSRYYGFDALRVWMMLLGIILHIAMPYGGASLSGYFVTNERSAVLQFALVIHYFRMPLFFLISGFFSAQLWERGRREFLHVRIKRVLLVWISALIIQSPLMALIGVYNHFASLGSDAASLTWRAIALGQVQPNWMPDQSLHLWFLEYLSVYCIAASLIIPFATPFLPVLDLWMGKLLFWRFRLLVLAIPSAAILWYMPFAVMPYPASLMPWVGVTLAYGWYYAVGWLIYRSRDYLEWLVTRTQVEAASIPVLTVVGALLITKHVQNQAGPGVIMLNAALAGCTALFVWSIIIYFIGVSYQTKRRKFLPYLADASYWIYLAHYPLALLMPALLREWAVPPVVKVATSTAFVLVVLLAVYDRFVRYGMLGSVLNGVRDGSPMRFTKASESLKVSRQSRR